MPIQFSGLTPLIQVFDMPTSVAFYRDILGFEIVMQSRPGDQFDWCLLRKAKVYLMLNTLHEADDRPPAPDPNRNRTHGDTGFYFDCADPDEAYEYLRTKGVAAQKPVVTHYGMRQLNLTDPDGYALCFQHPVKTD